MNKLKRSTWKDIAPDVLLLQESLAPVAVAAVFTALMTILAIILSRGPHEGLQILCFLLAIVGFATLVALIGVYGTFIVALRIWRWWRVSHPRVNVLPARTWLYDNWIDGQCVAQHSEILDEFNEWEEMVRDEWEEMVPIAMEWEEWAAHESSSLDVTVVDRGLRTQRLDDRPIVYPEEASQWMPLETR
jgi:hypothetical protein